MRRNYPNTYDAQPPEAVSYHGAVAVAQAESRARELRALDNPPPARLHTLDDGRKIVRSDAPSIHRKTRADASAIGNRDSGAHELRAHDLRRASAKRRAARKRVNDVKAWHRKRGTDLDTLCRSDARLCFYVGASNLDSDYAAQSASAWLWIAGIGVERRDVAAAIAEACAHLARQPQGIDFVRGFARDLAPISVDRELIGDLYAIAVEAHAIKVGYAAPSVLITNGKRVGGTANQRVWDARPWERAPTRSKPVAPSVETVPAEKSESLSAVVWEHANNGNPTVSLGTDRADDAARIVRAILAHTPENLATSHLATCSASAWAIAVGAVKHACAESNPSLVRRVKDLARYAAKVRATDADSFARRLASRTMPRTSDIVSTKAAQPRDPNVVATCKTKASVMRAFARAKAIGARPIIRIAPDSAIHVIVTHGPRAAHTAGFGRSLVEHPSEQAS